MGFINFDMSCTKFVSTVQFWLKWNSDGCCTWRSTCISASIFGVTHNTFILMEIDFSIKDVEKNKDTFSVHFTVLKIIKREETAPESLHNGKSLCHSAVCRSLPLFSSVIIFSSMLVSGGWIAYLFSLTSYILQFHLWTSFKVCSSLLYYFKMFYFSSWS